ncbi:acyltransferase [Flavobacterium sp. LB3P21]|uniref:acyltransferase n=1 Tax=Flavobacterium sp. LB3P21 TaxID=3401719 RepID=UPI003AAD3A45
MLVKIINQIITRIKSKDFKLDHNIPSSYLFSEVTKRCLMFIRGNLSFTKNKGLLFIGKGVTVRAKNLIVFGRGVSIDDKCFIDALSKDGIHFGDNVSLGKRTVIECSGSLKHIGKGLIVGNDVGLGRDCFYGCAGGIKIGSDTIIGNYVSFHSENHNYSILDIPIRLQGVNHMGISIGKNCWLGAKVTILDGVHLGDGCIVAAGAVLTAGAYKCNTIYGGVPAKKIKTRE